MRIIIDNGAHTLRNVGDIAMLQVAIQRIRECYPRAELMVLTTRPDLLPRYCPGTTPLSVASRDASYDPHRPALPRWKERWQRTLRQTLGFPPEAREFQDAFATAGAVVLTGGGFLNDLNPTQTRSVLRMLAHAGRQGKRIALFSQGLGPLLSPELLSLLNDVCRHGAYIGLRERCRGPQIVGSTGATPGHFCVTGDDAIELAWRENPLPAGDALGFSLRQIAYSGIEAGHREKLSATLKQLREILKAELVPLPVSFNPHEADPEAIQQVLGTAFDSAGMDSPEVLIGNVARCRVLVTGTYHAAVFALSRGIPCVGFYASPYYRDKFEGLALQFPGGLEIVDLNLPSAVDTLVAAARRLWRLPAPDRAGLQTAAGEQVKAGRSFYHQALQGQSGLVS